MLKIGGQVGRWVGIYVPSFCIIYVRHDGHDDNRDREKRKVGKSCLVESNLGKLSNGK